MNFDLDKKEKEIQQTIFSLFGEMELEAIAAMESTAPAGLRETTLQLQRALAKTDWWSLGVDGQNKITSMQAVDSALARVSASFYLSLQYTRLFSQLLTENFSQEVSDTIIESFQRGEFIGALASDEASGQSLPFTSVAENEDGYVLNGQKSHVANAFIADQMLVLAEAGEDLALCLVKPVTEGIRRTARTETVGLKGLTLSNFIFDSVVLPKKHVAILQSSGSVEMIRAQNNLIVSAAATGLMSNALLSAQFHSKTFEINGKTLASRQGVRYELAEMLTLLQASELACQRAAWALTSNGHEALILSQCAASFTCKQVVNLCDMCLGIVGIEGYKNESTMSRVYNDAKGLGVFSISQYELQMNIAETLLAKY